MSNKKHFRFLVQGVEFWNEWREEHPEIRPDLRDITLRNAYLYRANLSKADLRGADLCGADLHEANLYDADLSTALLLRANFSGADLRRAKFFAAFLQEVNFSEANLYGADLSVAGSSESILTDLKSLSDLMRVVDEPLVLPRRRLGSMVDIRRNFRLFSRDRLNLSGANLIKANLSQANLSCTNLLGSYFNGADLSRANLSEADLFGADLFSANLREANLSQANLSGANLSAANLCGADLTGSFVYAISAWDVELEGAIQSNLVITNPYRPDESAITVDNLEVAQFIYLLLDNKKIRDVIDTITSKVVLILGRFTPERKAILDAIREKLRSLNFLPIVFDFERPTAHDFTETIMTLAGFSSFIIADITNPKSSPLELQATIPNYMTPFVPIIQEGEQPFAMFIDLQNKYRDWVLNTLLYDTPSNLVNVLERAIVKPALERQAELLRIKAQSLRTRHIQDYF